MNSARPIVGGTVCERHIVKSSGIKTAGRNFTAENFFWNGFPAGVWTPQRSLEQAREHWEYPQATGDGPS